MFDPREYNEEETSQGNYESVHDDSSNYDDDDDTLIVYVPSTETSEFTRSEDLGEGLDF